ncbi:maleylpyruvate isomerase N-terminal domain-containing protein [Mycobacterium sp. DL440]|uniref:maleylpyruvate isomerase N-terminal domain-containing protein n=1 Tax=Mycobacterium sp. DL440 TaxID=2675523 RepID=UPI00142324E1|nr:maleylpyruvate isomerase N-terminal domain-containing protein [Mycobacterium sp. DL440]
MTNPFNLPLTCYDPGAFIATGYDFLDLVKSPEVARRWSEPSALERMSVGAVAAHGLGNLEQVLDNCERPEPATARFLGIVEYTRSARLDKREDLDKYVGHAIIIDIAEQAASEGPGAVIERAEQWLEQLRWVLPAQDPNKHVYLPRLPPMAGALAMMVANRTNELIVHMDDVAVSVNVPTPPIRPQAAAMALTVLVSVSRKVNTDLELIRVMARAERAKPDAARAI